VAYAIAGSLGLSFLLQTLHRLSMAQAADEFATSEANSPMQPMPGEVPPGAPTGLPDYSTSAYPAPSPLQPIRTKTLDPRVRVIFRIWVVVFGLVGAQMSWILRPFVGNPDQPFTFFRERDSHFFEAVLVAMRKLFS